MNWQTIHHQTLTFLEHEKHNLQRKIPDQHNGLHSAHRNGCCAAEWDLEILESIIAAQQSPNALSLESVIICKADVLIRQIGDIQWKTHKPSPKTYWHLECQRAYLGELLQRYHALRRNGARP